MEFGIWNLSIIYANRGTISGLVSVHGPEAPCTDCGGMHLQVTQERCKKIQCKVPHVFFLGDGKKEAMEEEAA